MKQQRKIKFLLLVLMLFIVIDIIPIKSSVVTAAETQNVLETQETAEKMQETVVETIVEAQETVVETIEESQETVEETAEPQKPEWKGPVLNEVNGRIQGPSGTETYYNLDMLGVINIMRECGYNYVYSVRADGVKMYGPYVMVAANLKLRPRGTVLETSLGTGMVCDTGEFAHENPTQLDIAVNW